MDWGWLTAFVGVIGAVLGSLVTGLLNRGNTTRQLEAQERIAAVARAEDRVKLLLAERRSLYGDVLNEARAMLRVATAWASWMATPDLDLNKARENWFAVNEANEPREAWAEVAVIYERIAGLASEARKRRQSLSVAVSELELVAPPEVANAALRLISRIEEMSTNATAQAELKRLNEAFAEFVHACRKDLGADPDNPDNALQTVR